MRIRSVVLGLLLFFFLSTYSYFGYTVVGGTELISDHFPIGVFGIVILLALIANPLLRALNPHWSFRKGEIAFIAALGLAACLWPGRSSFRMAIPTVSMPHYLQETQVGWQDQNVMSYVPSASPLLGQGHVKDWVELAKKIASDDTDGPALRIREMIDPFHLRTFKEVEQEGAAITAPAHIDAMTRAINLVLSDRNFYEKEAFAGVEFNREARRLLSKNLDELSQYQIKLLNRALLVSAFPDVFLPPPSGMGVLLAMDGDGEEALDGILLGHQSDERMSISDIPWGVWWPNILIWGGLLLVLAGAAICMALIVHQQWYKNELLSYPIARFVTKIEDMEPGAWLSGLSGSKSFWIALAFVFGIRLLNGFAAWFDAVPALPLHYSLMPLRELFPAASSVTAGWGAFNIFLFPTFIGFAYFLKSKHSFTIGIANYAWVVFAAFFIARGVPVTYNIVGAGESNLLRFGSYIGLGLMLLYTGRHYYSNVAAGAFFLPRYKQIPPYAIWAGRVLIVCFLISVFILTRAGLPAIWAVVFLLMTLLIFVVMSRVISETGFFWLEPLWLPAGILTGLLGAASLGPTTYIVMAVASLIIVGETSNLLMPYLNNGLVMCEENGASRPARLAPWFAGIVVVGFVVVGITAMYIHYYEGQGAMDRWSSETMPRRTFDALAEHTSNMSARGILSEVCAQSPVERLRNFSPQPGAYIWFITGLVLVLVTAFAHIRIPWWPFHPVMFIIWGTWSAERIAAPFLIGWAIKSVVVKVAGAEGYNKGKPIMVGLIAGDLLSGILWVIVGICYYFITGYTPVDYSILSW